ncbi:MAG: cyclic nucleotide-binding domain-containing protein, partial [Spirochaetales bacterium]|nr:cyclic nucleotide-binding domain-containing protein [Spirochaetales bacterium]
NNEQSIPDFLAELPIFENLSGGQRKQVSRILHERKYTKGETVFNEAEPGAGLYIIESGRVAITKHIEGGEPAVLATIEEGNFFGELALIDEIPRSATAIAFEDTVLLAFPKPDLDRLVSRHPQLAVKILYNLSRLVAQRMIHANENLRKLQESLAADSSDAK